MTRVRVAVKADQRVVHVVRVERGRKQVVVIKMIRVHLENHNQANQVKEVGAEARVEVGPNQSQSLRVTLNLDNNLFRGFLMFCHRHLVLMKVLVSLEE